jgi:hypothetical protein
MSLRLNNTGVIKRHEYLGERFGDIDDNPRQRWQTHGRVENLNGLSKFLKIVMRMKGIEA